MSQITGETIKSAIAKRIKASFTQDGVAPVVYKEQILQGFKKPSFFIWTIDVAFEKRMFNNYRGTYNMEVRYHAQDDVSKLYEHLCSVGTLLLEVLSTIELPITVETEEELFPVRGKQLDFKIQDNVLLVYVTYNIDMKKYEQVIPSMEQLNINN